MACGSSEYQEPFSLSRPGRLLKPLFLPVPLEVQVLLPDLLHQEQLSVLLLEVLEWFLELPSLQPFSSCQLQEVSPVQPVASPVPLQVPQEPLPAQVLEVRELSQLLPLS